MRTFDLRALGGDDRATLDKRARLYMGTASHSSEGPQTVKPGLRRSGASIFTVFQVLDGATPVSTVAVHEEHPRLVRQSAQRLDERHGAARLRKTRPVGCERRVVWRPRPASVVQSGTRGRDAGARAIAARTGGIERC